MTTHEMESGLVVVTDDVAEHRESRALRQAPRQGPQNPHELVAMGIQQGIAPEALMQLMDRAERWEANVARSAFVAAMAAFKADPPIIRKTKTVKMRLKNGGELAYKHAPLDEAAREIGRAMAPHGLSFRWETQQEDRKITVTCIVEHEGGHSTRTTLSGPPDESGQKNPVQMVGSTVTYLERYTLMAATGVATSDDDDDGRLFDQRPQEPEQDPYIPEQKAIELKERLEAIGFEEGPFLRLVGRTLKIDPPESMFQIPPAALRACENWLRERELASEPGEGEA